MTHQKISTTGLQTLITIGSSEGLHIALLGGFQLQQGNLVFGSESFQRRKACTLVKLLALAPGHRLQRDQLLEWLWPGGDLQAQANNLHQALRYARSVLGSFQPPCQIRFEGEILSLYSDLGLYIDIEAFEAVSVKAKQSKDMSLYQAALALYTGDLLPEDRYEEWTISRREALQQTFRSLLFDLARLHETKGEFQPAIAAYLQLITLDPLLEEAQAGLMRSYALSGQRAQALRQYHLFQEILFKELDVEPDGSTKELFQMIQAGKFPGPESQNLAELFNLPVLQVKHHNLPAQLTSFVGREHEIARIKALMMDHRLVTLTGSGGVGKTRLALKVAGDLQANFSKGAWLVELGSISDAESVPQACAQVLGILEESSVPLLTRLINYLENKQMLLVLDNCEHLVNSCACLVDALQKACPLLSILATSRETLGIPGEAVFHIPSMSTPSQLDSLPTEELRKFDAVRLFIDRAANISPDLIVDDKSVQTVVNICQRLDGIPLAIELAAGRTRMLSIEQIANQFTDTFRLLTGGSSTALPRQQTLRASIDWSYNLLSSQEQRFLQSMSVYAGGWTLEAAEAMWNKMLESRDSSELNLQPHGNILDLLRQLVAKSLVIANVSAVQPRYRLLETVRQYALKKLQESGNEAAARNWHLDFFASLSEQAHPKLRSRGMVAWLNRLDEELGNLRAALEWSMASPGPDGKIELGMQIVADLAYFWWARGLLKHQIHEVADHLLSAEEKSRGNQPLEGNRCLQRARLLVLSGFRPSAYYSESIQLLRSLGVSARRELGISLFYYWGCVNDKPEFEPEFLEIFRQEGELFTLSEYLVEVYGRLFIKGEIPEAKRILEESLAISRQIEDIDGIAFRNMMLSDLSLYQGDYRQARSLAMEALNFCRDLKNRYLEGRGWLRLLKAASAEGKYTEASQYAEVALSFFKDYSIGSGTREVLSKEAENLWSKGDYEPARVLIQAIDDLYANTSRIAHLNKGISSYLQGRVALTLGDTEAAEELLKKAYTFNKEDNYLYFRSDYLAEYVVLCSQQGKMETAARYAGAIDNRFQTVFLSLTPRERDEYHTALGAARLALCEEKFQTAWEEGQAMTLEQVTQEILAS